MITEVPIVYPQTRHLYNCRRRLSALGQALDRFGRMVRADAATAIEWLAAWSAEEMAEEVDADRRLLKAKLEKLGIKVLTIAAFGDQPQRVALLRAFREAKAAAGNDCCDPPGKKAKTAAVAVVAVVAEVEEQEEEQEENWDEEQAMEEQAVEEQEQVMEDAEQGDMNSSPG